MKATGQLEGVSYEDFSYEGYGAGGVAIMVEGSTDNRNRTVANVRHAFSKTGGNLGENGCVAWMFQTQGIVSITEELVTDEDALFELASEHGAEDFETSDGVVTIICSQEAFVGLREALETAGYNEFVTDEITKVAETSISPSVEDAKRTMRLLEMLEDDDDIENVYSNFEPSDDVIAALS